MPATRANDLLTGLKASRLKYQRPGKLLRVKVGSMNVSMFVWILNHPSLRGGTGELSRWLRNRVSKTSGGTRVAELPGWWSQDNAQDTHDNMDTVHIQLSGEEISTWVHKVGIIDGNG